jgi:hypothetical protein
MKPLEENSYFMILKKKNYSKFLFLDFEKIMGKLLFEKFLVLGFGNYGKLY